MLHRLDSRRYLTWTAIASALIQQLARGQCDLPFLKFIMFRVGYHFERSFGGLRGGG